MMKLKYKLYLESVSSQPCPCLNTFSTKHVKGYRFLRSSPVDKNDFIPPAIMNSNGGRNCEHYALSFFDSLKSARKKFKKLNKRIDAVARYGKYIGEVDISIGDGLLCAPGNDGHMDLHLSEDAKLELQVSCIQRVIDEDEEGS